MHLLFGTLKKKIFFVLAFLVLTMNTSCLRPANKPASKLWDMEASLTAKADPNFFIGMWEIYPTFQQDEKYAHLWAEFKLDDQGQIILVKGKELRTSGESLAKVIDHTGTLNWLNTEIKIINEDTLKWTLHDWDFVRTTTRVPTHTKDFLIIEEMIKKLQDEYGPVLKELFRDPYGKYLDRVSKELKSWQGTNLTADQLVKIELLNDYLKHSSRAKDILENDLDALEREIFRAKMVRSFSQLTDLVVGASRCGLSMTDFGDLYGLTYGKDLCSGEKLDTVGRVISAIALIGGNSKALRKMVDGLGIPTTVAKEVGDYGEKVVNSAGDVIKAMGPKKFGEILKLPKGARPNPETYLPKEYIASHLGKFDEGASYLVPKDTLDTFGRDILGHPDNTQFIVPKGQLDKLLNQTGKNVALIEKELGLNPGTWQGKTIVRIDISNPRELNIRIPSGNERGANDLWLPGGRLPKGEVEAVVNNIPKGKYIEREL